MADDQPTVMSGKEHYLVASSLLAQLPEKTSESFEEHTANIELVNAAGVHALLAIADLLDDNTRAVKDLAGRVDKRLKVVR